MNHSDPERSPGPGPTVRRGLADADRVDAALRRVTRSFGAAPDRDLSPVQRQLVRRSAGGTGLTELAESVGLPKSTASVMVGELVRRRLLERVRARTDARRVEISPTPAGIRRAAEERVLDPTRLALGLAALAPEQRAGLLEGLDALVRAGDGLPGVGTLEP